MVEIREVTTARQLAEFCKFPIDTLYRDNPNYVPDLISEEKKMLDKRTNPALEFCDAKYFLAYKDDRIVGRIAGIISHAANKKWDTKRVRFSRIDFEEDIEIAEALLQAVEDWGRQQGMEEIHGPIGYCDLDQEGMLVEGFEYPSMNFTVYNYPYYPKIMEELGYTKDADWVEYRIQTPSVPNERIGKLRELVLKRYDLTLFTPKNRREINKLVRPVLDIINRTYDELYGAVKLTDKLLDKYYKQFRLLINPKYLCIIKDKKEELVGFGLAMPSINEAVQKSRGRMLPFGWYRILRAPYKKTEVLDLYLVGVIPQMQNKGLPAVLIDAITRIAIKNGVRYAETGPELELNKKVQALWEAFPTQRHKRRRCYIKSIQQKI